jgi:hypothetical protein
MMTKKIGDNLTHRGRGSSYALDDPPADERALGERRSPLNNPASGVR